MKTHKIDQYSDKWWKIRNGKPSASCAGKLITGSGVRSTQITEYAYELAGDIYAGKSLNTFKGNIYTERGAALEGIARLEYEMLKQVTVSEIGMFSDDMVRWIASPDGVIGDDGLVEIKCLKPSNHIKVICDYNKTKKTPKTYIPQIQMQLFLSGRKWNDLFFYNPDLPMLVIRQYPDVVFQKTLKEQLDLIIIERNLIVKELKSIN